MKALIQKTLQILSKKEKRKLRTLLLLNLLISMADIVFLGLLVMLVNYCTNPADKNLPEAFKSLNSQDAIAIIIFFVLIFCIKNIAGYQIFRQQYRFVYNVAHRISTDCIKQYLSLPYQQYVAADKAVWQRKISQQPVEFAQYMLNGFQLLFTELVISTLAITGILFVNAPIFLLLLAVLAPPFILLSVITRRRLKEARSSIKTSSEKSLLYLHEALSGYTESSIFNKKHFFVNRYHQQQSALNKHLARIQTIQALPSRLTEIFAVCGLLVIILLNKFYTGYATTTLVEISAFSAAAYKLLPGIVRIYNITGQMKSYAFTVDGLQQSTGVDANGEDKRETSNIYSIECRNLYFTYGERPLFNGQNLAFTAGWFTAITGASGIGKTSLFHLITGFNEPASGTVSVNGVAMSTGQLQALWHSITYVPQQSFFIRDTVRNNILLGDEHPDEELLSAVATVTGLYNIFPAANGGLEQVIYEDGKNISGGQRQRIAITRALYKSSASVLLLDEPFNELDEDAEKSLMIHFSQLAATGKIILLITHNRQHLDLCTHHIEIS